jgi:hypothetical protein
VEGIEELREPVPHALGARWSCGCPSFSLFVDEAKAPRSTITKSLLSETGSKDSSDPDQYYELMLWVSGDGWLDDVEFVSYGDDPHGDDASKEIPPLDHWAAPQLNTTAQ